MFVVIITWVYIALMISVTRWPDVPAMLLSFLLLGGFPLVIVIFIIGRGKTLDDIRRRQRARRDRETGSGSVQNGMGEVDRQHPRQD